MLKHSTQYLYNCDAKSFSSLPYNYEGEPILKSGNTELLVGPIEGLEEEWL